MAGGRVVDYGGFQQGVMVRRRGVSAEVQRVVKRGVGRRERGVGQKKP